MQTTQSFEQKNEQIRAAFRALKRQHPERMWQRLNFSWSNWGFGIEPLEQSLERLRRYGVRFIELHGNHYGPDMGYDGTEVKEQLQEYGISVSGVCGMFSADNDLSSNRAPHRQAAVDYLRRELAFTAAMGGDYILVVPGAVGRNKAYDDAEFERSVETLRMAAPLFTQYGIRGAIEPIRSAEVSFVHTIADAQSYIRAVGHPGVAHINGDVYHMQSEEAHIGEALLAAGDQLINLHLADSNRCALGMGSMDLDTIIRALYLIEHNRPGRYVTPEPLGPGGDPYPAMFGKTDPGVLDELVRQSAEYFRAREEAVLAMD
ncbi:MAG TPA: sugar phosphate isomerase/epimerase family protein [Puia sp.]|nr:sugar phosphate isomerase/epimerase family protein [Puia sp.]